MEKVITAIGCLYSSGNEQQRKEADKWLRDWQQSREAWQVANQMLEGVNFGDEVYLFAAQTLRGKICFDFLELPEESYESLCSSLFDHLERHNGRRPVEIALGVAVADLALQAAMKWTSPVESLMHRFPPSQPHTVGNFLSLLKLLPEEATSSRVMVEEDTRRLYLKRLREASPEVLKLLSCLRVELQDPVFKGRVLFCWHRWISVAIDRHEGEDDSILERLPRDTWFDFAVDAFNIFEASLQPQYEEQHSHFQSHNVHRHHHSGTAFGGSGGNIRVVCGYAGDGIELIEDTAVDSIVRLLTGVCHFSVSDDDLDGGDDEEHPFSFSSSSPSSLSFSSSSSSCSAPRPSNFSPPPSLSPSAPTGLPSFSSATSALSSSAASSSSLKPPLQTPGGGLLRLSSSPSCSTASEFMSSSSPFAASTLSSSSSSGRVLSSVSPYYAFASEARKKLRDEFTQLALSRCVGGGEKCDGSSNDRAFLSVGDQMDRSSSDVKDFHGTALNGVSGTNNAYCNSSGNNNSGIVEVASHNTRNKKCLRDYLNDCVERCDADSLRRISLFACPLAYALCPEMFVKLDTEPSLQQLLQLIVSLTQCCLHIRLPCDDDDDAGHGDAHGISPGQHVQPTSASSSLSPSSSSPSSLSISRDGTANSNIRDGLNDKSAYERKSRPRMLDDALDIDEDLIVSVLHEPLHCWLKLSEKIMAERKRMARERERERRRRINNQDCGGDAAAPTPSTAAVGRGGMNGHSQGQIEDANSEACRARSTTDDGRPVSCTNGATVSGSPDALDSVYNDHNFLSPSLKAMISVYRIILDTAMNYLAYPLNIDQLKLVSPLSSLRKNLLDCIGDCVWVLSPQVALTQIVQECGATDITNWPKLEVFFTTISFIVKECPVARPEDVALMGPLITLIQQILLDEKQPSIPTCYLRLAACGVLRYSSPWLQDRPDLLEGALRGLLHQLLRDDLGEGNDLTNGRMNGGVGDALCDGGSGNGTTKWQLLVILQDATLRLRAAEALRAICCKCKRLPQLHALIDQLCTVSNKVTSLSGSSGKQAQRAVVEGVGALASKLPDTQRFLQVLESLCNPVVLFLGTQTDDTDAIASALERLAVILRDTMPGLGGYSDRADAVGVFVNGRLYPLVASILVKHKEDAAIVEMGCRVMKHSVKSIGHRFKPVLSDFILLLIKCSETHMHSTYLYAGEWLVKEFREDADVRDDLIGLFSALCGRGLDEIEKGVCDLQEMPDLVEDCYGMLCRYLYICPDIVMASNHLPKSLLLCRFALHHQHRHASTYVFEFLDALLRLTASDRASEEARVAAAALVREHYPTLISVMMAVVATAPPVYIIHNVEDFFATMFSTAPEEATRWINDSFAVLPAGVVSDSIKKKCLQSMQTSKRGLNEALDDIAFRCKQHLLRRQEGALQR